MTDIMREAREQFFAEFGGWRRCTEEMDQRDVDNVFRRTTRVTDEIRKKASAYYMVNYKKFSQFDSRD